MTPTDGRDSRWAAHRVARRRELVEAALRAIRAHGAGVGMDEIAAEAGTSKTVVYRHLGDRVGLYRAVCDSVDALILSEIQQAASATAPGGGPGSAEGTSSGESTAGTGVTTPEPRVLGTVIDSYLRLVERDPEVYRFVVRRPQVNLPEGPADDDPVTGLSGRIADSLAELLLHFDPEHPQARARARALSWALVGLVKESADRWLENPEGLTRAELTDHLARFAHTGLRGAFTPADHHPDHHHPDDGRTRSGADAACGPSSA